MTYRNQSFRPDGNYFLTTTNEWETIKTAAMQRGREARAEAAATIIEWIIRQLGRAGRGGRRFVQNAWSELARCLDAAAPAANSR